MARPVTKRQVIERTAMRLFAHRGLASVTIKDIAREASCAEGALYRHYRSKEEMAWHLFRLETEKLGARIRSVLQANKPAGMRLQEAVELICRSYDDDPVTFSFVLLTQHDFPRNYQVRTAVSPDNLVLEFIRKGIRSGIFRCGNATLAAALVLGLVLQPATWHAKGKLKGSLLSHASVIVRSCLEVLHVR